MTTAPDTPLISGGPIRHRQPAWAMMPFHGQRAHYWHFVSARSPTDYPAVTVLLWRSACGLQAIAHEGKHDRLEPGNFPRCKRCAHIRKRLEPS